MGDLSGLATSGFSDKDEGLVVAENAEELVFLLPHGERAALLEDLQVPRRVGPAVPPVDGRIGRGGGGGTIDAGAAELGGYGGLVNHVEEAYLALPLRPHGGGEGGRWCAEEE